MRTVSGGACLSPDGRQLACWSLCRDLYLYDMETHSFLDGINMEEIVNDYDNVELYVQYVHGGRDILIASNTGRPCIVDVAKRKVVEELMHCSGALRSSKSLPIHG